MSIFSKLLRTFNIDSKFIINGEYFKFTDEQQHEIHLALSPEHDLRKGLTRKSRIHHQLLISWAVNPGSKICGSEESLVQFKDSRKSDFLSAEARARMTELYVFNYGARAVDMADIPRRVKVSFELRRTLCCCVFAHYRSACSWQKILN